MEIFGFEIKRKSDEDNAPSFVAPINDDGAQVLEIGQGGYSIGGGMAQGSFIDMEGGVKSEQDLIVRYRQMSLIPEVDMAIDDIVQEAISNNDLDSPVGINLDSTKFSDSIKSKIREEFVEVLRLLRFNQTSSDVFRKWYVDGRMYFHLLVDPKNAKKGIVGVRMIDPIQIKKIREVQKKKNAQGIEVIDKVDAEKVMLDRDYIPEARRAEMEIIDEPYDELDAPHHYEDVSGNWVYPEYSGVFPFPINHRTVNTKNSISYYQRLVDLNYEQKSISVIKSDSIDRIVREFNNLLSR